MKMKGSGCTDQQNRTAKIEEDFRDPGSKGSDTWTVSHLESHSRQIVPTEGIVTERENEEETVGCCIKLNHQMLMGAEVKLIHGQFLTLLSLGHGLSFHAYRQTHNEILNSLPVTTMTLLPIFFSHGFFLTASLKRGASSGLAFWISCWPQLPSGEMSFILSGPCSALPAGSIPA